MRLHCIGRYRAGPVSYEAGQVVELPDAAGEYLLRDSPGSFTLEEPAPNSETSSGLPAHDRRARGGHARDAAQPEATTGAAKADGKKE